MSLRIVGNVSVPIAKLVAFENAIEPALKARMREKAEAGLSQAKATVHVENGDLRATGRVEQTDTSNGFETVVVFGGEIGIDRFVDYAGYEEMLHPYLMPAMEDWGVEGGFASGFDDATR